MATFIWQCDEGAGAEKSPRLRSAQFGEGYSQEAQDGMNAFLPPWEVSFSNRAWGEIQAIDAFLEAAGGTTTFDWTPPGSSTAQKFRCKKWKPVFYGGSANLTATFQKVPM